MFTYKRRVQFAETDLAGIVHFSVMFLYMEEAEHAMWRAAGLSIADPKSDLAWPRLSASLEFRNPLRFEEEFEVRLQISALKTRIIEYACRIVRDETLIASGSMAAACARKHDGGGMRAAELPAEIVERLKNVSG
jgi:acyl-CoA thioester hydrolase